MEEPASGYAARCVLAEVSDGEHGEEGESADRVDAGCEKSMENGGGDQDEAEQDPQILEESAWESGDLSE